MLLQVSRSIGDAYLKKAEFNREPLPSKFRLAETFFKPIMSCEPSISSHKLHPDDQFLIFASDGLWEHLSNQEAVHIVSNNAPNVRLHSILSIQGYYYHHSHTKSPRCALDSQILIRPSKCSD